MSQHPLYSLNRILSKIFSRLLLNKSHTEQINQYIETLKIEHGPHYEGVLLIDIPDSPTELIEQIAFAKYFSETYNLKPTYYYPTINSRVRNILIRSIRNYILNLARGPRYARKANILPGIDHRSPDKNILKLAADMCEELWSKIDSKESIMKLKLGEVEIGIALYDTYLRLHSTQTVFVRDQRLKNILLDACILYYLAESYFEKNNVTYVLLGHCVYVNWKIFSDYAQERDATVYVTYNSRHPPLHNVNANRGLQTTDHSDYKSFFNDLEKNCRSKYIELGKTNMERRLSGYVDDGIHYMQRSSYVKTRNENFIQDAGGSKKSIFVMLHSFFDSPHIYKSMVFPDFYNFLEFTLDYFESHKSYEKYEIFVKPHPNRLPGEDRVISEFMERFSFVREMSGAVNNIDIMNLSPACVITVYGSVAAEFAYRGVPVITCGDNPTSSFNFTFEAKDIASYERYLSGIDYFKLPVDFKEQIGAFMYMHYFHGKKVDMKDYPFTRFIANSTNKAPGLRISNFSYSKFADLLETVLQDQ